MNTAEGLNPELAQNLPLLRSEYLKSHPPTLEFWGQWGVWGPVWSQSLCPVYFWEDVLFVGCSQLEMLTSGFSTPENFTGKIVFLLCETEALENFYKAAQGLQTDTSVVPAVTSASSAPSDDPFAGLTDDSASATPSSEGNEPFELKDSENSSESGEGEKPQLEEPIAGLELDLSAPSITLTPANGSESSLLSPLQKLGSEQSPAPAVDSLTVSVDIPTEPLAEITVTTPAVALTSSPPATPPATSAPALAKVPASIPTPDTKSDDFTSHVFQEMKSHFIKSMLFKKQGNALTPWKWDSEFQPQVGSVESPISLGAPSPFRIVSRTMKPYHGFLVQNEISEKFFEEWNSSQIPDHLTIYPILDGDQMIGALLGIAEKAVNQKASLALANRLAEGLEESLKKEQQLKAS